ncbi:hypothetical protein P389DRAFT_54389 [Cystobasidium minutum MCA 4210]|uniref:uncharacterized protein n=1 Tax=Cystobasidium minutum MCA 4210 TaxID=1397322 RepID=UPI0034CE83A7|eukprot:jgi/Rhomi1/54389/CE54388_148
MPLGSQSVLRGISSLSFLSRVAILFLCPSNSSSTTSITFHAKSSSSSKQSLAYQFVSSLFKYTTRRIWKVVGSFQFFSVCSFTSRSRSLLFTSNQSTSSPPLPPTTISPKFP